jgi:hypothetical protein
MYVLYFVGKLSSPEEEKCVYSPMDWKLVLVPKEPTPINQVPTIGFSDDGMKLRIVVEELELPTPPPPTPPPHFSVSCLYQVTGGVGEIPTTEKRVDFFPYNCDNLQCSDVFQ